jgi:uncharacterized protein YodC (DUF2158 family)
VTEDRNPDFERGDVVALTAKREMGEYIAMTVQSEKGGWAECVWFEGYKFFRARWPTKDLHRVDVVPA